MQLGDKILSTPAKVRFRSNIDLAFFGQASCRGFGKNLLDEATRSPCFIYEARQVDLAL
jgi:hypothetical protein